MVLRAIRLHVDSHEVWEVSAYAQSLSVWTSLEDSWDMNVLTVLPLEILPLAIHDEWHHIAATYDMEELKMYVNGVLEGTQQKNLEPATNQNPLQMGMIWGAVDEFV